MQSVVGIFPSVVAAEQAVQGLLSNGMTESSIVFLSSGSRQDSAVRVLSDKELDRVPTTDAESDGMGKALGAVLGGAVGGKCGIGGRGGNGEFACSGSGHNFCPWGGCRGGSGTGGRGCGSEGRRCYRTCDGRWNSAR